MCVCRVRWRLLLLLLLLWWPVGMVVVVVVVVVGVVVGPHRGCVGEGHGWRRRRRP
jgi:hypothetical protein